MFNLQKKPQPDTHASYARVALRTINGLDIILVASREQKKSPSDQRFFCASINKPGCESLDASISTDSGIKAIKYEKYFSIFLGSYCYFHIEAKELSKFNDFCKENDYEPEWKATEKEEKAN